MYREYKNKKNNNKTKRALQEAAYTDMVKSKPSESAEAAFRHKPYKLDFKKEEKKNGKER